MQSVGFHPVVLRIEGTFDARAATRLGNVLATATAGEFIVLDFRGVRDCHEVAIAHLAQNFSRTACRVSLQGLSWHQRRILRYFGVDDASLAEGEASEAPVG